MNNNKQKSDLGAFKYKMPINTAKNYLSQKSLKMSNNDYLCQIVNSEFGIKGTCIEVILY